MRPSKKARNKKIPRISVIIPTYNRADMVGRAVQSVLNQTYQDFEIIIIDDGSTDSTEEIIRGFHDPRIRYIRHERNRGGSAARNSGICAAQGEYIAFLDSDDEWLPQKLEKQFYLFKTQNPEIAVVYTAYAIVDERGRIKKIEKPRHSGYILQKLLASNCIGASTVMAKKICFTKDTKFDETLPSCQDWDMWIRLAKKYNFAYIPEILVKRYEHSSNRITADSAVRIAGREIILKKFLKEIERQGSNVKAEHYFWMGNYLCHFGDIKKGRKKLFQALLIFPWNPKYFLHFFISLFGKRIYIKLGKFKQKCMALLSYPFNKKELRFL